MLFRSQEHDHALLRIPQLKLVSAESTEEKCKQGRRNLFRGAAGKACDIRIDFLHNSPDPWISVPNTLKVTQTLPHRSKNELQEFNDLEKNLQKNIK